MIDQALTWSITGAIVLSENNGINPKEAKESFTQFLSVHPPPSEGELKELTELSEQTESQWIRDTGVFACNRVTEISERINYHTQVLEEMVVKDKQRRQSQELLDQADTRTSTLNGESPDSEVGFSAPKLRHQSSEASGSLTYDDTGADRALLLLKSVDTAAQTAVERMDSGE